MSCNEWMTFLCAHAKWVTSWVASGIFSHFGAYMVLCTCAHARTLACSAGVGGGQGENCVCSDGPLPFPPNGNPVRVGGCPPPGLPSSLQSRTNWKDKQAATPALPWLLAALFANGFKNPVGALAILCVYAPP